ncbi:MAG: DUF58 domain-containing protein [Spirochaetota bacterium]
MNRVALYTPAAALACFLLFDYALLRYVSLTILSFYGIAFIVSRVLYVSCTATLEKTVWYCYSGAQSHITLTVRNRGIFGANLLVIDFSGAGRIAENVARHSVKTLHFSIPAEHRGVRRAGPVHFYGSDPFRFFPWHKTFDLSVRIIVYPRLHPPHILLTTGESGGRQKVRNPLYEDLSCLTAIRDYRPGDTVKRINWKASARTGSLQVMEFSQTLSAPVFIILDINLDNYPLKQRYGMAERAIEGSASIMTSYNRKGEASGFIAEDSRGLTLVQLSKGSAHLVSVLTALSYLTATEGITVSVIDRFLSSGVALPQSTHVFIFTPVIDEETLFRIVLLQKKRLLPTLVNTGGRETGLTIPAGINYAIMPTYGEEYL